MRAAPLLIVLLAACPRLEPSPDPTPPAATASLVCDRDYFGAFEALAESASDDLVVAQFSLYPGRSTDAIQDLLVDAADRGVRVRVLLDDEVEQNEAAVASLRGRGVDAKRDDTPTTMHAKMAVADGRLALVGSTNWSDAAIERNRECNLLLEHAAPPAYIAAWFDALWADPAGRSEPEQPPGSGDVIALVNDDLLPHLTRRIGDAREAIDFTMYATFLQPTNLDAPAMQVFGALADAAARGVVVRGVAEHSDWNPDLNAQTAEAVVWLRDRGVLMRWEDDRTVTHAKAVRIDDGLQIESANFSTSGFERNQEVGAWTARSEPVAAFEAWFEALWSASSEDPS